MLMILLAGSSSREKDTLGTFVSQNQNPEIHTAQKTHDAKETGTFWPVSRRPESGHVHTSIQGTSGFDTARLSHSSSLFTTRR
jgi:hypothetical protein